MGLYVNLFEEIARGQREVPVTFEDADQTPLKGRKANILR